MFENETMYEYESGGASNKFSASVVEMAPMLYTKRV